MFPRRYFPASMFAPMYFPQSQGDPPPGGDPNSAMITIGVIGSTDGPGATGTITPILI